MANTQDFVIDIGADTRDAESGLDKLRNSFDRLKSNFSSITSTFSRLGNSGIVNTIKNISMEFLDTTAELGDFNRLTGISTEKVSQLGAALANFGGDTRQAMQSLGGLQDALLQAKQKGGGALVDSLKYYGVELYNMDGSLKDASSLYMSVADTMTRLSKDKQRDLGGMLGLSESDIRLMQQGSAGIQQLIKQKAGLATITQKDAQFGLEWRNTMNDLKLTLSGLGRELARMVLPFVKKLIDFANQVTLAFRQNNGVITSVKEGFSGFSKVIDFVTENFRVLAITAGVFAFKKITGLNGLFKGLGSTMLRGVIPAIKGVGVALKGLVSSFAPMLAFSLVLEDIAMFMSDPEGTDTLTGRLVEFFKNNDIFKGFLNGVEGIKNHFKDLWEMVKGVGNIFKGIFTFDLDLIKAGLSQVQEAFISIFTRLKNFFLDIFATPIKWVQGTLDKLKGWFGFSGDEQKVETPIPADIPALSENTINNMQSSNNSNVSEGDKNVTIENNIIINDATTGQKVMNKVPMTKKDALQMASY